MRISLKGTYIFSDLKNLRPREEKQPKDNILRFIYM